MCVRVTWRDDSLTLACEMPWCITHACDTTLSYLRHGSFVCVTWLFRICDMTLLYMWYDSFINVPWLFRICEKTLSCRRHDSFIYLTWLFRVRDMISPRQSPFTVRAQPLLHLQTLGVIWLTHACDMSLLYVCLNLCNFSHATHCKTATQCVEITCEKLHKNIQTHVYLFAVSPACDGHATTRCNTLQHTTAYYSTLRHAKAPCDSLHHAATRCNTLRHAATHCKILQPIATHCDTLQHTATCCSTL